jgi:hypothetical protein
MPQATCLAKEIYNILYNTYRASITEQSEAQLLINIKRLVVKQCNAMAAVMSVLSLSQDSDQGILNFISQLKAAARLPNQSKSHVHMRQGSGGGGGLHGRHSTVRAGGRRARHVAPGGPAHQGKPYLGGSGEDIYGQ